MPKSDLIHLWYRFRVSAVNKYGYSDNGESESVLIGGGGDAGKDESVRNM